MARAARPGGARATRAPQVIPYLGTTLPPIQTMIRYFGAQASPANETSVNFAGHQVQVNRVIAGVVQAAGNDLAASGFKSYIRTVGGFRTSVGASGSPIPYSMHQFGAAIDINEDGGPNGNWQTMTLPPLMVAIMARHHFFCGQAWAGSSRDGGHFQYTGGTAVAGVAAAGAGKGPAAGATAAGALVGLALAGATIGALLLAAMAAGALIAIGGSAAIAALGAGQRSRAET
jgi:D-alanyl-D-alanine carboxypeptidase